mmetsp:Transcript_8755/g.9857  ORF Transcript_8755/g.9857 Transcript_8755/m.9857 type:complete len:389 (+) Transcript_8755:34-1200(+)
MGNLCSSPQRVPEGSRKDPTVYKKESNKMMFEVVHGDICSEKVDAIVNPSNTKLQGAGGVSQLIAEKGGEKLQEEINKVMNEKEVLEISSVVVTNGGSLSVKHVIHVALPVWRGGAEQEMEQFVAGIKNALMEADKHGFKSIAIPAVGGNGVGGFPKEEVTKGLINACAEYSKETSTKTVESIRFVSNDPALVKFLQEFAENTLSPKENLCEAVNPNHQGENHVEEPKGHSPQATTDLQSENPTSPTKDESHEQSEAHKHVTEEQPKHEATSSSHEEKKEEHHHEHKAEEHHTEHKTEEHVEKHEHVEETAHKEHHEAEKKEETHHEEHHHHEEQHHHEEAHHEEAHKEEAHHEEHHEEHHEREVHESKPEENQEAESQPEGEAQEAN